MVLIPIKLVGSRNQIVTGEVRSVKQAQDILSWFSEWLPHMYDLSGKRLHEDSHWKVPDIWEQFCQLSDCEVLMLEADNQIQGYIVIYLNYPDSSDGVKTYIPFLAAAPWNRNSNGASRKYQQVGKLLVGIGALRGFATWQDPRLELHSLPGAENFYRRLRMSETGRVENSMKEFRLDTKAGFDLLRFILPYIKT